MLRIINEKYGEILKCSMNYLREKHLLTHFNDEIMVLLVHSFNERLLYTRRVVASRGLTEMYLSQIIHSRKLRLIGKIK